MYSVLTYIFGDYDILREIPQEEDVEYICVTDNPDLKQEGWKIVVDEDLKGLDPLYASFYVRYHPFKYCKGSICMRIDGSVKINKPLLSLFQEFEKSNKDIMVMTNPRATTLQGEYFFWGTQNKQSIDFQKQYCKDNNINITKQGNLQSSISITRNNELCNKCDALCWELIDKCSTKECTARPSQAIMTIAVEQTKGLDIMFVDEDLYNSDTFSWHRHGSDRLRFVLWKHKQTSFFDKLIKIYNFNVVYYKPNILRDSLKQRMLHKHFFYFKKQDTTRQNMPDNK